MIFPSRLCLAVALAALIVDPAFGAVAPVPPPAQTPAPKILIPIDRQLHYLVTVEATQDWKKNDPKYPGEQWSKATTTQRYEVTTRLRSDGEMQVRNYNDPSLDERLEAKTIFLARQAKKEMDRAGTPFKLPTTPAEKTEFSGRVQAEMYACQASPTCGHDTALRYAALFAVIEHPEALQPDTVPGTYQYFLPYRGCPNTSRVTLEMQIEGIRFNKTVKKFVPFSEHHSADTVDGSDGLALCDHFNAVIDTEDKAKPMYLDNVFIPRPIGITTWTEGGHTATTPEPQPVPTAVIEWLADTLRHATPSGKASTTVPLSLSLNGNSTWLGQWTGSAKINFEWSFTEVPATH